MYTITAIMSVISLIFWLLGLYFCGKAVNAELQGKFYLAAIKTLEKFPHNITSTILDNMEREFLHEEPSFFSKFKYLLFKRKLNSTLKRIMGRNYRI